MALLQRSARAAPLPAFAERAGAWWSLIKDLQTGLLLTTALAGYATGCCRNLEAASPLAMLLSLFLAISGSTVLNMVLDRDIDAVMSRTAARPIPSGKVAPGEALAVGAVLTAAGLAWSWRLDTGYAAVVFAGVFLDVVVYTALLKRRTAWAVVIGGVAGGMPVLAGRTLAAGAVDAVGVLLALAVLAWIPTHIMTLGIKYAGDYRRAGVPVFPNVYGERATRGVIAGSSVLAVALVLAAGWLAGVTAVILQGLIVAGGVLAVLVALSVVRPAALLNRVLYKSASLYMLVSMVLLVGGGL